MLEQQLTSVQAAGARRQAVAAALNAAAAGVAPAAVGHRGVVEAAPAAKRAPLPKAPPSAGVSVVPSGVGSGSSMEDGAGQVKRVSEPVESSQWMCVVSKRRQRTTGVC